MTRYIGESGGIHAMTAEEEAEFVAQEAIDLAPLAADVDTEKDRRNYSGFGFSGNTFDSDPVSLTNISGAATLAGFALTAGAVADDYLWHATVLNPTPDPFLWITQDNLFVQMDAQSMFALGQAAATWIAQHTLKARVLKNTVPIPADFANDSYWS